LISVSCSLNSAANFGIRSELTLAAVTHEFGIFVIALAPAFEASSNGPFTKIEVIPSSSPQPVAVGEEVTHTIVVKNRGPKTAVEVNLKVDLDAFFGYEGSSGSLQEI
jgi:uncharacterized protein (DUF58 family)